MKLIVGLGNPGLRYRNTRHNAGFMVIDALAGDSRIPVKKKNYNGIAGTGRIRGEEVTLFKPLTYMNLSGTAVKAVCEDKLEDNSDLLVIADDFNLTLGIIRLREKGSSGGHNGIASIIDMIGSDFARLRIGIGIPGEIEDPSSFVLSTFSRREKGVLLDSVAKAVECVKLWLKKGPVPAMNEYN